MAGTRITIEVDEASALAVLRQLTAKLTDMTPVFRDIGEEITIQTKTRIEAGGPAPGGDPWAPLSDRYKARKKKMQDHILILYGHLLRSIHYQESADSVEIGTNLIYGATHQLGRDNIPARPYLGISAEDGIAVVNILRSWL